MRTGEGKVGGGSTETLAGLGLAELRWIQMIHDQRTQNVQRTQLAV